MMDGIPMPRLQEPIPSILHIIPKWGVIAMEVDTWPYIYYTETLALTGVQLR